MDLLENPVHRDAWGSPTAIPELLGRAADGSPQSELWVGAHPSSPSSLVRAGAVRQLDDVITDDPAGELGASFVDAYGARLPFLLKVLAASRPLSLQAHPSVDQAEAGFRAEERLGVGRDADERSYPDAHHKPEMLCALTTFEALCGFRAVPATRALFEALEVPALAGDLGVLAAAPDAAAGEGLRAVLERWFGLDDDARAGLVDDVVAGCRRLLDDERWSAEAATAVELAQEYPGDVGVVAALLLNRVTLEPGQAVFLAAGNLHAYLRGVAVEVMASSDNVLRAGLTGRPVDHVELLRVLDTTAGPAPMVEPRRADDGVELRYPVPVPDFALSRLDLRAGEPYELPAGAAQVLLVVDGEVEATQPGAVVAVRRGQALYVPSRDPAVRLRGEATVFRATSGLPPAEPAGGRSRPAGAAG